MLIANSITSNYQVGMFEMTIAERVKQKMDELDLSQGKLAKRVGIAQPSLNRLLAGNVQKPRFLPELADALGVNIDWLINGSGEQDKEDSRITLHNGFRATIRPLETERFTPLGLGVVCNIKGSMRLCELGSVGEQQVIYEITALGEKSAPMSFYPEQSAYKGKVRRIDGTESKCRIEGVVVRLEP